MALPSNRIFLRSPYYVNLERADLSQIVVELYVYTGELTTDKPADYQYKLVGTAFVNDAGNKFAEVDIAELARDYVEVNYNFAASSPTNAVWIEYDLYYADDGDTALTHEGSYQLTGLNGYGYFEDGYNPDPSDTLLQSVDYIVLESGEIGYIPVLQDYLTTIKYYDGVTSLGALVQTVNMPAVTENTANVIYYASTSAPGFTTRSMKFEYSGGRADEIVSIIYKDECKHPVIDIAFVNRFGAIQTLQMFGKSTREINTSEEKYKRNLLDGEGSYNTRRHQNTILEKNGIQKITVNSGFYPEEANGLFQELALSERVWMEVPEDWLTYNSFVSGTITAPVNLVNSSIQYKSQINDKLINYTLQFEFATDRINSIR